MSDDLHAVALQQQSAAAGGDGARVMAAIFLCTSVLMGICFYGFIVLLEPLSRDLGWSPVETGSLFSAMWMVAPLALVSAPLVERFGAWRLLVLGLVLHGAAIAVTPAIGAFWQLYALRLAMGVGKVAVMTAAPLIIARAFPVRFPLAMSIVWAGCVGSGVIIAPATQRLVDLLGWRETAWVLAAAILVTAPLVRLIAGRGALKAPRSDHLAAAGVNPPASQRPVAGGGWGRFLRSANWWLTGSTILAMIGAGITSIAFQSHELTFLAQAGLTPATAAQILGLTSLGAMVGSSVSGWLVQRFHRSVGSLAVSACVFGGLLLFNTLLTHASAQLGMTAAFAVGFGLGGGELLWITVVEREAGVELFAVAYGIWYFSVQIGYAAGGALGGWALEHLLSRGFLLVVAAFYAPAALFSLWRPGAKSA